MEILQNKGWSWLLTLHTERLQCKSSDFVYRQRKHVWQRYRERKNVYTMTARRFAIYQPCCMIHRERVERPRMRACVPIQPMCSKHIVEERLHSTSLLPDVSNLSCVFVIKMLRFYTIFVAVLSYFNLRFHDKITCGFAARFCSFVEIPKYYTTKFQTLMLSGDGGVEIRLKS